MKLDRNIYCFSFHLVSGIPGLRRCSISETTDSAFCFTVWIPDFKYFNMKADIIADLTRHEAFVEINSRKEKE